MNFRQRWRRFGLAAAAHHILLRRVLGPVMGYAPYRCLYLPADAQTGFAPSSSAIANLECREVSPDEMARYAADPAYELNSAHISAARGRGECCFGAFVSGKLVSYCFNTRLPREFHPGLRYTFPAGCIWHYKAFTLPQWRGNRLHGLNLAAVLQKFRQEPGFTGFVTVVMGTNYPSLASLARMGFMATKQFVVLGNRAKTRVFDIVDTAGHRIEKVAD